MQVGRRLCCAPPPVWSSAPLHAAAGMDGSHLSLSVCDADPEAVAAAQLNCIHLIHAMAKLLPGWLPKPLFTLALQRWRSPEFQARWVFLENEPGPVKSPVII